MAVIFPSLPSLPDLGAGNPFLSVPPVTPGGINTGWNIPIPGVIIAPGSSPSGTPAGSSTGSGNVEAPAVFNGLVTCIMSPGSCLLRIVFLILGILCIAGAIYLYKPTNDLIVQPAKRAGKAAALAMAEA